MVVCDDAGCAYTNRDIIGDITKIEDWSGSVKRSTCQGLDLSGQASRNKQSDSLVAKQGVPIWKKRMYSWQVSTRLRGRIDLVFRSLPEIGLQMSRRRECADENF